MAAARKVGAKVCMDANYRFNGGAFSALKHGQSGDFARCTLEETENLVKGISLRINR